MDEPTTGLSLEDCAQLLHVLHRLVDGGNTVIVIEHQFDVIKNADWVIDLGPHGGQRGGELIAEGTPEQVAAHPTSVTAAYLRDTLAKHGWTPPAKNGARGNGARPRAKSSGNGRSPKAAAAKPRKRAGAKAS